MPKLYNTTAMLISGNLKEGKNGDGCSYPTYITIQILLSTPHGDFSETNINSTGNKIKK